MTLAPSLNLLPQLRAAFQGQVALEPTPCSAMLGGGQLPGTGSVGSRAGRGAGGHPRLEDGTLSGDCSLIGSGLSNNAQGQSTSWQSHVLSSHPHCLTTLPGDVHSHARHFLAT